MLGTQRQIGQRQANWPKFCLKCLQTVNKVPWTLVLPLMDDSPPTALTHLTKSIARAPSSPPAQAALNLHSNWRYSFPKWQLALTPCQAPSWMVEMQRWASSRRRLPSQPWSAETCLGGKLGSWRMGSPWHISWLGEPMRQLAAAPPDIALLSWEHGSFLFKNKKYF